MDRVLDGVFFRVKDSNGSWTDKCFSDLTEKQMHEVLEEKDRDWIEELAVILGKTIKNIGNTFDIEGEVADDDS